MLKKLAKKLGGIGKLGKAASPAAMLLSRSKRRRAAPATAAAPAEPAMTPAVMPSNEGQGIAQALSPVGERMGAAMSPAIARAGLQAMQGAPQSPFGSIDEPQAFRKGGSVKGRSIDGCAQRGKTRGRYI